MVALDRFATWAQNNGPQVSSSTADKYKRELERFVREVGNPATVQDEDLRKWREALITTGYAPSTINLKIAAVRALYAYCDANNISVIGDPATLQMRSVPRRLPKPVNEGDIDILFDYLESLQTVESLQDRAIMETLYGSGIRRRELGMLTLGAIESRDQLRVIGKGDKERLTIITDSQYGALQAWSLHEHGDKRSQKVTKEISASAAFEDLIKRKPDTGVFVGKQYYDKVPTPTMTHHDPGWYIYRRVQHYRELLGIEMAPHRWRHSFATGLLNNEADIGGLKEMMGHATFNQVMGYAAITKSGLRAAKRKHPRRVG